MSIIEPDKILEKYNSIYPILEKISKKLHENVEKKIDFNKIQRIDRITARAKSPDSFLAKAQKLDKNKNRKYQNPFCDIQDQIGVRIITCYLDDVEKVRETIEAYYTFIEAKTKKPESVEEFGYEAKHYIFHIPEDLYEKYNSSPIPKFFELQIKTLFQHAWSEAEHDLGYKPENPLNKVQRRKIAFTAAQAWGADNIFNEVFTELNRTTNKL